MKTQVGLATALLKLVRCSDTCKTVVFPARKCSISQQQMWGLRRVPALLPVAIALLLTGCPTNPSATPVSETGHTSSHSASPAHLTRSEQPSAPTGVGNQSSPSSATGTKNTTDDQEAVRQAVLNDPSLNESLRQAFERVGGRKPEDLHPLQVGAIAIVENYALAEVSGGVLDLPVIDGYYLLKKQSGQWLVVDSVSEFPGEISTNRLASLGLPDSTIQRLLDALQATGVNPTDTDSFTVTDSTETSTIPRSQVVLGGISVDMTLAEVRQRLGEPLSQRVEETDCCGVLVYLEYPTLSLGLTEDETVFSMSTTHLDAPTGAGVRVGDPREAVIRAYGPPSRSDGERLIYDIEGSDPYVSESLSFLLEGGHVAEISYYALLN